MQRKIFVLMLVAVVLLITGAYAVSALPSAVAYASGQPSAAALQPAPLAAPKLGTVTDWETTLEGIYTRVNPSVVLINVVDGPQPGAPNSPAPGFGFGPQQGPQSC